MIVKTQTLRGFQQRLATESVSNLAGVLGRWILPRQRTALRQAGRRRRVFTPLATFWNFLAQVLSPSQPCRETVRPHPSGPSGSTPSRPLLLHRCLLPGPASIT